MAAIWKPRDREVYLSWIKAIIEQDVELNEWDNTFITSIFTKLQKFNLTELQAKKLEDIYAERTR